MDQDQQRDFQEERYNADLCPLCDYSPCVGNAGKGSCDDPADRDFPAAGEIGNVAPTVGEILGGPADDDRPVVQIGWDGRSKPIYRYQGELHLAIPDGIPASDVAAVLALVPGGAA